MEYYYYHYYSPPSTLTSDQPVVAVVVDACPRGGVVAGKIKPLRHNLASLSLSL